MLNIKKQINKLYASSILGNISLSAAWVAILAARGFSLTEIGIAEACFHLTSILMEIPSGVLADVFGRKKMLIVSSIMHIIANIVMIASNNLLWVCISIAFNALCYNFASGSGDALAYDTLKTASKQQEYEKYVSNQLIIYRLFDGLSTMCAGLSLYLGHKISYGVDIIICIIQLLVLRGLIEVGERTILEGNKGSAVRQAIINCFRESFRFMRKSKRAFRLMFFNSLLGSFDILLLFFLQAKFPQIGLKGLLLGVALFATQLGGILGSKLILLFKKAKYYQVYITSAVMIFLGFMVEHTGVWYIMVLGGIISALGDDAIQIRTNAILQDMFPSEQRATLISIDSFIFSLIMIVLSPLAGIFFSVW
ncbi:MAG: MFS transporter [Saccharofermentans sp.]|nr:MFS transporter [Saccharofermentans sp.]